MFGLASDNILAGNFVLPAAPFDPPNLADGFHKLAAYGRFGGTNRWLIDTDNSGVPELELPDGLSIDGLPLAGRFWDGVVRDNIDIDPDSDQVGVKRGTTWYLDTNANLIIDAGDVVLAGNMPGMPVVGDFDGDGIDDLGSWVDDVFYIDLSSVLTAGPVNPDSYDPNINGYWDVRFDFGFTGVRERPFAADFDGDGIDDIGLWVPDRSGATPVELAEWYFVMSGFGETLFDRTGLSFADLQLLALPTVLNMPFTPRPFGNDIYAQFGDNFALPIVGNFDPPVVPLTGDARSPRTDTNHVNPLDVNADGNVSALDALMVINLINNHDRYIAQGAFNFVDGIYPDVNGDSWITALDVLLLINDLNRTLATGPAGEGESSDVPAMVAIADQPVPALPSPPTAASWSRVPVHATDRPVSTAVQVADWPGQPATASAADALFAEMAEAGRFGAGESEDETDSDPLFDDLVHDVDRWWKTTV
jgi:large repetitive protein